MNCQFDYCTTGDVEVATNTMEVYTNYTIDNGGRMLGNVAEQNLCYACAPNYYKRCGATDGHYLGMI